MCYAESAVEDGAEERGGKKDGRRGSRGGFDERATILSALLIFREERTPKGEWRKPNQTSGLAFRTSSAVVVSSKIAGFAAIGAASIYQLLDLADRHAFRLSDEDRYVRKLIA